jgi:hypothetical protein
VTAAIFPYQGSTYAVVHQSGPVVKKQLTQPFTPMPITTVNANGVS